MADYSWHQSPTFNRQVLAFHDRYARVPKPDISDAKRLHELYTNAIRDTLKKKRVCSRFEYTGSSYDGVKVRRSDDDSDLEFDIMVILRCDTHLRVEPIDGKPLFVKLFLDKDVGLENPVIRKAVMGANNLLSAEKVASRFMGELQQCLQQCQEQAHDGGSSELAQIKERIKLRKHGPAVQMDVYHLSPGTRKKQYSVDMVPTIQISGRDEYYVPKPIKDAPGGQIAWRRSFSLKEKQRLVTIDKLNNGCRKQVLRVLKVIRNKESGLAPLTSYHLKTVLFRKSDELSNWKIDCLGRRLMDVIGQIEKELDRGIMPHYFLPGVNLLDGMGLMTIDNMRQRLKHLYSSEREMRKVIFVDSNVICGGGIYEESAAGESFRVYTNQASSDTSTLCINVCILLLGPIVACIVGILLMYITTAYILAAWRLSVEVAIAAARPSQLS